MAAPITLRLAVARRAAQASTEVLFTLKVPSVRSVPAMRRWSPSMARTVTGSRVGKRRVRGLASRPVPAANSSSTVLKVLDSVTTAARLMTGAAPERKKRS